MNEWEWQLLEAKKPVERLAHFGYRSAAWQSRKAASAGGRRCYGHRAGG